MLVEVTATNSFMVSRPVATPLRPQHRHAVLEAAGAVRDLGEIADAHALLLGGEGAMVGGDHLQRAGRQAGPQRILVASCRGRAATSRGARHSPSPG